MKQNRQIVQRSYQREGQPKENPEALSLWKVPKQNYASIKS